MQHSSPTTKELIRFLWKYISLQRGRILLMFFLSLVWVLDAAVMPYILGRIIDVFTAYDTNRETVWPALKWLIVAVLSLWVIVEVGFRTRDFLRAKAFPKLQADIRMAMFDHVQHHSPKYFNEHFAGALSNKISDMTTEATDLIQSMFVFLPAFFTCMISIFFFFEVNSLFAIILSVWVLVHFGISFFFLPKCVSYSHIHGEARSSLAGKVVDSLTNNFAVNLFSRFRFERQRIVPDQADEIVKNERAQRIVAWMFTTLSLSYFAGSIVLFGFMISYWMQGIITTGEIIQIFNTTFNLTMMMWFTTDMLPKFFQSLGIASQALTVMQDPQDILDAPACCLFEGFPGGDPV